METTVEIEGMSCDHCVRSVREALSTLKDIRVVKVEVGRATLASDAPISRDAVGNVLAEEGYRLKD